MSQKHSVSQQKQIQCTRLPFLQQQAQIPAA